VDYNVVKVNPSTDKIDDDESKNTKVMIWMEAGPFEEPDPNDDPSYEEWINFTGVPSHDIKLDCSGNTFEEAIINLAKKVMEEYGDYDEETEGALI